MVVLRDIFTWAINHAYPDAAAKLGLSEAIITRCGNISFGDYQCNNAMSLSKALKSDSRYSRKYYCNYCKFIVLDLAGAPKDIAANIIVHLPQSTNIIQTAVAAVSVV